MSDTEDAPLGWEGSPGRRPSSADGARGRRAAPPGALAAAAAAAVAASGPQAMLALAATISAARTVARWRERRARGAALKAVLAPPPAPPDAAAALATAPPAPPWADDDRATEGAVDGSLPPLPDGGTVLVDTTVAASVRRAWREVACAGPLASAFHAARGDADLVCTGWRRTGPGASIARCVSYAARVRAPLVAPRSTPAAEAWTCVSRTDSAWTATVVVATPGVPCGDSFRVRLAWACARAGPRACRVRLVATVDFGPGSPVGLPGIRSVVSKAAMDGLRASYAGYPRLLAERVGGGGSALAPPPGGLARLTSTATLLLLLAVAVAAIVLVLSLVRQATLAREVAALRAALGGGRQVSSDGVLVG